jgi:hypothetical protein
MDLDIFLPIFLVNFNEVWPELHPECEVNSIEIVISLVNNGAPPARYVQEE